MGNQHSQHDAPHCPSQVVSPTASVEVVSPQYLGVPIDVSVRNTRGITDSHYVALYRGNERVSWKWVRNALGTVSLPALHPREQGADDTVTLKYFVNGGIVATGDVECSREYVFKNPLRSLRASQASEDVIEVHTLLETVVQSATLKLSVGALRLWSSRITAIDGRMSVPSPRISGQYELSVLSGLSGDLCLGKCTVDVVTRNTFTIGLFSPSSSSNDENLTKALTIPLRATIHLQCFSTSLSPRDCVFVVRAGDVSVPPDPIVMQTPLQRAPLRADRSADINLAQEGVFYAVLALYHPAGTFLEGDRALITVSSLASPVPPGVAPVASAPWESLPAVEAPAAAEDERLLCVVCRDQCIEMKLDPCKHVALCRSCYDTIANQGRSGTFTCPLCRAVVESAERIFIP